MPATGNFKFYPSFAVLEGKTNVTVENSHKLLNEIIKEQELSVGNRQVGSRSYHIFYFKNDVFSVYYHGGGTDALYSSKSLDEVLAYVNSLNPEDFE